MRAPLSVVIPTKDAEADLPRCLGAVWEGMQAGILREVIVVDGGSTDNTVQVADEAGARVLHVAPSRGGQLRAGGAEAKGDWVLFLHADCVLMPGWSDAVIPRFAARKAGYFRLRFDAPGWSPRIVAGWANLRARLFGLPYGDQALLLPRRAYRDSGGYPDIPLMEDVAIVRKLRGQLSMIDAGIVTSAARYQTQGWLRRGTRNFWILTRYLCGASPEKLAAEYRR